MPPGPPTHMEKDFLLLTFSLHPAAAGIHLPLAVGSSIAPAPHNNWDGRSSVQDEAAQGHLPFIVAVT